MIQRLLTSIEFAIRKSAVFSCIKGASFLGRHISKENLIFKNSLGYADGAGAQAQRIISVASLANILGFKFQLFPIKSVEPQPIESFVISTNLEQEVIQLNSWLDRLTTAPDHLREFNIVNVENSLELFIAFLKIFVKEKFGKNSQNKTVIEMLDSYFVTNFLPNIWKNNQLVRDNGYVDSVREFDVHIHFRLSTFSKDSDRRVPLSYYSEALQIATHYFELIKSEFNLIVHTDFFGEQVDTEFLITNAVPQSLDYWKQLKILNADNSVNEELISEARTKLINFLKDVKNVSFYEGSIWHLEWETMASAKFLIASKSSYSLIGGILNSHGTVIAPSSWSARLSNWENIETF